MEKLMISGRRIIGQETGAEVILHGLNVVNKNPAEGCLPGCTDEDFAWMQEKGFNLIRLGMIWSQAEPEPGRYDDGYLKALCEIIRRAERYGLYVFPDMHQDLYSQRYADGAPDWATLTDGLPHIKTALWSDAYLQSPAVMRALDHFWENAPAPDGTGLQDHYAALWKHAASFFGSCPNVLGYDLMNEPFPGSRGQDILGAMLAAYVRETKTPPEKAQALLSDREKLLEAVSDRALFEKLTKAASVPAGRWEKEVLLPFYRKLAAVLPGSILLTESSYFSNMSVQSALERLPGMIYSPHIYDLTTDTGSTDAYSAGRIRHIAAVHRLVQERLDVPVLAGEWGAFYNMEGTAEAAAETGRIFAQYGWSDAYWSWDASLPAQPCFPGLCRAYPQRTGGRLISYSWENGIFTMTYRSDGTPTRIYHPLKGIIGLTRSAGHASITL